MSYKSNSSITRQDLDKARFSFTIDNFPDAKRIKETGEEIESERFSIMASQFTIGVYPSGESEEDSGFVSVILCNVSDHTVTVDYTLTVGRKVGGDKSIKIESKTGKVWPQFIKTCEVGLNMVVAVEVTLVKEEILDEAVGGLSLANWQLGKKSEAENHKKMKLELEQKLEQKFEEKLEKYVENKLEKKLKDNLTQLDKKIDQKFEDLKEDIKAPARAPECPICFEELKPPMKIIQCLKGHKMCEPCSQKPDIVSCPGACKTAFMGRDFGMEAFLLEQFKIRRQ